MSEKWDMPPYTLGWDMPPNPTVTVSEVPSGRSDMTAMAIHASVQDIIIRMEACRASLEERLEQAPMEMLLSYWIERLRVEVRDKL